MDRLVRLIISNVCPRYLTIFGLFWSNCVYFGHFNVLLGYLCVFGGFWQEEVMV